jgi:hypothetical protein
MSKNRTDGKHGKSGGRVLRAQPGGRRPTIANILKRNGITPEPERIRKAMWKEFLNQHREKISQSGFRAPLAYARGSEGVWSA